MKISNRQRLLIGVLLITATGLGMAKYAFDRVGKSPGELMDYTERRLEGHPKIEFVAIPVLSKLRDYFNAPTLAERKATQFLIDKPPVLRTDASGENLTQAPPSGRVLRVSKKGPIYSVASAARLAQDGDVIEIESGSYYGDVAVWHQKKLSIRGVGGNARFYADGRSAEDKGIWVFRHGDIDISNIEFINARVSDHNGAGIRFEGGNLSIRNCLFWGNENGILANAGEQASIEITDSEFGYNGSGNGLTHAIYIGQIKQLKVTGSYFHHGNVGHLIKSRAQSSTIAYNRITDESGGRASYEIDLPNGGAALLIGNIIQQTQETENSAVIAYGFEGYAWPDNSLTLVNNTIVNDLSYGGSFLRAKQGAGRIVSVNNLFVGNGRFHTDTPVQAHNDQYTDWASFIQPNRYNYSLSPDGQRFKFDATAAQQVTSVPNRQYLHPHTTKPLAQAPQYAGAVQ